MGGHRTHSMQNMGTIQCDFQREENIRKGSTKECAFEKRKLSGRKVDLSSLPIWRDRLSLHLMPRLTGRQWKTIS